MSLPVTDTVPWSRHRWFWTILIIILLHFAAIYFLSDFNPVLRRQPPPLARLVLINQPAFDRHLVLSLATQDPTLFALAGKSNFSGTAWLNPKPIGHQLYGWKDGPYWIEPRFELMRQLPSRLIAQAALPDSVSDLKPPPRLQDLFVTNVIPSTESLLRVEGPLTNRVLSLTHDLPAFQLDRSLPHTIVQVAVDARGRVISARLWESSRFATADTNALQYAKSLRFKPLPNMWHDPAADPWIDWSFLVFEWATIDAPAPVASSQTTSP